jgi:hypothetical protein
MRLLGHHTDVINGCFKQRETSGQRLQPQADHFHSLENKKAAGDEHLLLLYV